MDSGELADGLEGILPEVQSVLERPLGGVRDLQGRLTGFHGLCHDGVNRAGPDASGRQVDGALEAHRVGWVMEHPEGFDLVWVVADPVSAVHWQSVVLQRCPGRGILPVLASSA